MPTTPPATAPVDSPADGVAPTPPDRLPRHIAIIMDGNGRWATSRGLTRSDGHRAGAKAVRDVVTECARLELDALTLYSFSTENWSRAPEEVSTLMALYVEYLVSELPTMLDNNVRFRQIGRREGLPRDVLDHLDRVTEATADNLGLTLVLAINYGARTEITDAVRAIAAKARNGSLDPDAITADTVAEHLYTVGLPDPDLLIRTAGEQRLSNYLLWQVSYAEIHVADCCWPDFGVAELHDALADYAGRHRKFGREE
ncbi:MAG: isoprenyl transferase [Planctomycetota bacterium]